MFPSHHLSLLAFEILLRQKTIPSSCRVVSQRRSGERTTHVRLWVKPCHTLIVRALCFFSHYECQFKERSHSQHWQCRNENSPKDSWGFSMSFVMRKEHNGISGWALCVYICDSGGLETLPKKKRVLAARGNSILCPAFETPRVPLK